MNSKDWEHNPAISTTLGCGVNGEHARLLSGSFRFESEQPSQIRNRSTKVVHLLVTQKTRERYPSVPPIYRVGSITIQLELNYALQRPAKTERVSTEVVCRE